MAQSDNQDINLILAAEEFDDQEFVKYHHFFDYEENIIRQLMAHGPVLLKGGRGTGKSVLLREASRRVNENIGASTAYGVYISLRHLPLLRTTGKQYETELLKILSDRVRGLVKKDFEYDFMGSTEVYEFQSELAKLSEVIKKRIVIFFDDAAHIGREAGLEEFFDIFRTLASSSVSCKAAIYPGVTRFGNRFDVYNDANIIELSRREDQKNFEAFFYSILESRFSQQVSSIPTAKEMSYHSVARFLGQAVVGNVRSFVKACSFMFESGNSIGMQTLTETFLKLSRDYYWPMIEEIKLKVGIYETLIEPSQELADDIYSSCGVKGATSCIIHRNIVNKLSKLLEILEYAGFIARRDASRAMKSGGRGTRYVLNLCNMLEKMPGSRLTKELQDRWVNKEIEDVQFSQGSSISEISLPELNEENSLRILELPIEQLKKSKIFPYGITDNKLEILSNYGYTTVGDLAEVSDNELLKLDNIGVKTVKRFRDVLGQAIWM